MSFKRSEQAEKIRTETQHGFALWETRVAGNLLTAYIAKGGSLVVLQDYGEGRGCAVFTDTTPPEITATIAALNTKPEPADQGEPKPGWCCPYCGGLDVEETTWRRVNGDGAVTSSGTEGPFDYFHCNDCESQPKGLHEIEPGAVIVPASCDRDCGGDCSERGCEHWTPAHVKGVGEQA